VVTAHEVELITSIYHPDRLDQHGTTIHKGVGCAALINRFLGARFPVHVDYISHACEIDRDPARCQTYVLAFLFVVRRSV
jgi:hypothetical protein